MDKMKLGIRFFFTTLLILLVPTSARNVIVFRNTGNAVFAKLYEVDTVSGVALSDGKSPQDFVCQSCLEVSRKIEKFLTEPMFLDKIVTISNDVCNVMPSDSREKCKETSLKYIHETVTYLQEYFSEIKLCRSTDMCPETGSSIKALNFYGNQVADEKSCSICRNAVKKLQDDLEDPENKIKVIRALLKVCENVEDHVKQCKKMVFEYGPLIMANIDKYLSNNDICHIIRVCDYVAYADENTSLVASSWWRLVK